MAGRREGIPTETADPALFDRAILETMGVRETMFAIGDGALVELADMLLLTLGRVVAQARSPAAARPGFAEAA